MADKSSTIELDKKLKCLEQSFYTELRKIAEQRSKLERESVSCRKINLLEGINSLRKEKKTKPLSLDIFTIQLESSLGEKLAKSRGTADELEDKLQETRIVFEDKLKTTEQMRNELDRRENVLVQSVQQIEIYLRAIFYLKREAGIMYIHLKDSLKEKETELEELRNELQIFKSKKESIIKKMAVFRPTKLVLEQMVTGLSDYSNVKELVEYYLVLKALQKDLLNHEAEGIKAEESFTNEKLQMAEFKRRFPLMVVSKENTVLDLKSKLRNIRSEITQLEEQMDDAIVSKVKDDAAWYDVQRWIKKIFQASTEIKPPGPEEPTSGTLNMLDRIKDFVAVGVEIIERLKMTDT